MSRPSKNNAEYFPHFTTLRNHRKVKALRNKFGPVRGYAFMTMILEWLTEQDGLRWDCNEIESEMFAAELGVSAAETMQMVDFCLRLDLLSKDSDGFIYSKGLNEQLSPLFEKRERERKRYEVKVNSRKIKAPAAQSGRNPVKPLVSATETPDSATETTQSRGEYSREEKTKEITSTSSSPGREEIPDFVKANREQLSETIPPTPFQKVAPGGAPPKSFPHPGVVTPGVKTPVEVLDGYHQRMSANQWLIEDVCMKQKISAEECRRDLEEFIREKKGDEHIPKDYEDVSQHFKSWMRIRYRIKNESKLNNDHATSQQPSSAKQRPFSGTGRTLRPTSRAHSDYRGTGSTCDVDVRASRSA